VRVLLTPALGPHEKLLDVIVERVEGAAGSGTTGSASS
jgi:hypothetical protein